MKLLQLILFNGVLVLINVLMIGWLWNAPATWSRALLYTVNGMSLIAWVYGNYKILTKRTVVREDRYVEPLLRGAQIDSLDTALRALQDYVAHNVRTFRAPLTQIQEQIRRFAKRRLSLEQALQQRFNVNEISYAKFIAPINQVEELIITNTRTVLNYLVAFDEGEYERSLNNMQNISVPQYRQRREILGRYTDFVRKAVQNNEEILLKLDSLLLEVSSLTGGAGSGVDVKKMDAMQQLDRLINDTKWYKDGAINQKEVRRR
jgi:hypothetical protein